MTTELQPTLQNTIELPSPNMPLKVLASTTGLHIESPLTFEEWSGIAPRLGSSMRSLSFVIGDWLVYGEDTFEKQLLLPGMEDDHSDSPRISEARYKAARDATGIDRAVLTHYAYVSRRVPPAHRNEHLSWEHHKAVARLRPSEQREWLERAASTEDRLTSRRLRVSIVRGEVVPAERLAAPPAEQGVLTHIPSINRLGAWWNTIGGVDWLRTRSTQQVSAILRDFQPVTSIIEALKTHLQFKQ
jgi:hypothetical protein